MRRCSRISCSSTVAHNPSKGKIWAYSSCCHSILLKVVNSGQPLKLHSAGLAVAVFGDDTFRQVGVGGVLVVVALPVEEHNDVGVLLDGARLTQVGEHGPLVAAALIGTGELAEAENGDVQLLGHDLQGPGDVGDHLLAVFSIILPPAGRLHQLEVVDDDQSQVVYPAALGVDVGHGDRGVVVNEDHGAVEGVGGHRHLLPVLLGKLAGDQLLIVYKALAGNKAESQLLPAHFQGEKGHIFPRPLARLQQDVQGHGGLTHTGTGGQKDEVGFVEARDGPVQVGETGGQAGNGALTLGQLGETVVYIQQHGGDGGKPPGGPALTDGVDPLLGGLQDILPGVGALLNEGGEFACRLRHPAQQGLVLDDADVFLYIGGGGVVSMSWSRYPRELFSS